MPGRLRLVIFDCDGTLVDSQHAIVAGMAAGFRAVGLPPPPRDAVRRVVGLPLVRAIMRIAPDIDEPTAERIADGYRDAHPTVRAAGASAEPLFPGMREALDDLAAAGFLLGVATGKGSRGLRHTLSVHGLEDRFATLQTADTALGKPDPDMVLRALAETGAEREDAVVVGDTVFDVQMSVAAGVPCIGVSWGYHEPAELAAAGAHSLVETCAAIPAAVERILGART